MNLSCRLLFAALGCLFACSHSQPFTPADTGTDQPWDPGPPARLTVNPANDGQISFAPGGAYLIYSFGYSYGTGGPSSCLALLPEGRARASRWLCPEVVDSYTSDGYSYPAVSAGSRLAFVLTRQRTYEYGPFYQAVLAAPLADLRDTAEVTSIPFYTPDSIRHVTVDRLMWLNEDTLVIQADGRSYLADLTARPRRLIPLNRPGGVTVVQPGPREGTLYAWLGTDTRLFQWDVARDSVTPVFDFAGINAGPVRVGRQDIVALTDSGLVLLRRSDGQVTPLATYGLPVSELAYAPDDRDLVVSAAGDLYRISLP